MKALKTQTPEIEFSTTLEPLMVSRMRRGSWTPKPLSEVVAKHTELMSVLQPKDPHWRGRDLHFELALDGSARLRPIGSPDDYYRISGLALSQFALWVLPPKALALVRELASLPPIADETTAQRFAIASSIVNRFLRSQNKALMYRTIHDPAYEEPTIRAVLSTSYTALDIGAILDQALAVFGKEAQVISSEIHHDLARFRLALDAPADPKAPVPMVELWTSEVGTRSIGLDAGAYRLICTNGMRAFAPNYTARWMHSGSKDRIKDGIESSLDSIRTESKGILDLYDKALSVHLGDVWGIVDALPRSLPKESGLAITESQASRAYAALSDPTTTQGGSVATVVDALTLAAQSEKSLADQESMEKVAAFVAKQATTKIPTLKREKGKALIEW